MNNRTANIFDAWIINQHNRLKERIASSTMFDDDAFQETYLFFSVLMKKTRKKLGKPRQRTSRRNKLMNM